VHDVASQCGPAAAGRSGVSTRGTDDTPFAPFEDARLPYGAIVRHIRENLARRIAVEELAGIARLSVFQLSRAFRRERATTPYRLVLELRIEHAKDRLTAGATIAETAFHAGFADQSHLTRHFKRLTGMTPKAYSARRAGIQANFQYAQTPAQAVVTRTFAMNRPPVRPA
jgi:AraC-like DNA-binding protein